MELALEETTALLVRLSRAGSTRAIYPKEHPSVQRAVADLLKALRRCLQRRRADEITFLIVDDEVVIDDKPLRTRNAHLRPFVRMVRRLGVQRLTLSRGFDTETGLLLASALAGAGKIATGPHLVVGQVEIGGDGSGGDGDGFRASLSEEDVDRGQHAFAGLQGGDRGNIDQLDQLVWRVIEGLATASRSLLLLAPVKSFGEHLFLHSINVSTLAVAQAKSLGIEGTALHEIGLGALLHDVGKLALPASLWSGEGRLKDADWAMAQLHPELGAAMLSGSDDVPPLAVMIAYEHHLRWDRQPSYPRCQRAPNLASQITAVADTWDAMATEGGDPLHTRRRALEVWRERSGTVLDPFLVGNFMLMMSEIGEGLA